MPNVAFPGHFTATTGSVFGGAEAYSSLLIEMLSYLIQLLFFFFSSLGAVLKATTGETSVRQGMGFF